MPEYNLKVLELIKLSSTAKAIRFDLENKPFNFFPGQFVMLQTNLEATGKFKVRDNRDMVQKRSFSLSSSPTQQNYLEVTVKTARNPFFSDYLVNYLDKGERVLIKGPFGQFYFDEKNTNKHVILIGAGSGISPLISILRYIHGKGINIKVHTIYSNKKKNQILWRKEIEKLSKSEDISHQFVLTREESNPWGGLKGRISKEIIERNFEDPKKTDFYLCGPPSFVIDIERILIFELGIPRENIKKEIYD